MESVFLGLSQVKPYGESRGSCGYCDGTARYSYGANAVRLNCLDYLALCDAGWRRSGVYIYMPSNQKSCCPQLTMRLDSLKFVATNKQNRLVKRWNRFLRGEIDLLAAGDAESESDDDQPGSKPTSTPSALDAVAAALLPHVQSAAAAAYPAVADAVSSTAGSSSTLAVVPPSRASALPLVAAGTPATHSSSIAFVVLAALKRAAGVKRVKVGGSGSSSRSSNEAGGSDAAATATATADAATPPVRTFPPPAEVAAAIVEQLRSRSTDMQAAVAAAAPGAPGVSLVFSSADSGHINFAVTGLPPAPSADAAASPAARKTLKAGAGGGAGGTGPKYATHTFRVQTVPAAFNKAGHKLYAKYQQAVHKDSADECGAKQYTRFLCDSPLTREQLGAPTGVALGVLDASGNLLPSAVRVIPDEELVTTFSGMGFAPEAVRAALIRHRNDGQAALTSLVGDADHNGEVTVASEPGQALLRCAAAVRKGWQDGENGGAGLPMQYGTESSAASSATAASAASASAAAAESDSSPTRTATKPLAECVRGFKAGSDYLFHDLEDAATSCTDMACGYGTFHQRYFLDDKLIAVGVIDILPHCLSSVYVFYDPELSKRLELGRLTALHEIQWVQAACARASPRFRYYYLGYYIHSCPKMRYKGDYAPADVRCPITGRWVPLSAAAPRLDAEKCPCLAVEGTEGEIAAQAKARDTSVALAASKVPLLVGGESAHDVNSVKDLTEKGKKLALPILREYLSRTGPELGTRMLLQLS